MPTIDNVLRLEIQKRLTELLEGISTDDGYVISPGYNGDLVGRVFRGRAVFGDGDPVPMVSILEVPIPLDQLEPPPDSTSSSGGWELMVQGFAVDDRDNPTDNGHILMAAVKKKLAFEKKKTNYHGDDSNGLLGLGRQVTRMLIGPGVVRPPDELSAKAYFWLTLTLDIVEDLTEPNTI